MRRPEVLRQSPPLFERHWIDRLTRTRPVVPLATLVRCLLVPATMTLLDTANWWAPNLRRGALNLPRPS